MVVVVVVVVVWCNGDGAGAAAAADNKGLTGVLELRCPYPPTTAPFIPSPPDNP